MSRVVFMEERCKGCRLCVEVCPVHILRPSGRFNRHGYEVMEMEGQCTGCARARSCVPMWPYACSKARKPRGARHERCNRTCAHQGNEAVAFGAIDAGCRCYFGYPITPQNEVPESLSSLLPEVGGQFVQAESEVGGHQHGAGCGSQRHSCAYVIL